MLIKPLHCASTALAPPCSEQQGHARARRCCMCALRLVLRKHQGVEGPLPPNDSPPEGILEP